MDLQLTEEQQLLREAFAESSQRVHGNPESGRAGDPGEG